MFHTLSRLLRHNKYQLIKKSEPFQRKPQLSIAPFIQLWFTNPLKNRKNRRDSIKHIQARNTKFKILASEKKSKLQRKKVGVKKRTKWTNIVQKVGKKVNSIEQRWWLPSMVTLNNVKANEPSLGPMMIMSWILFE